MTSAMYSWLLAAFSASPAGLQKVAALPAPLAWPALPPPASVVTTAAALAPPHTDGVAELLRDALDEALRDIVALTLRVALGKGEGVALALSAAGQLSAR